MDVEYHCSSQCAGHGHGWATSVNSQVTSTPNVPKVNNATAKPSAVGTIIKVPSHLGLSLVVAILSALGGTLL